MERPESPAASQNITGAGRPPNLDLERTIEADSAALGKRKRLEIHEGRLLPNIHLETRGPQRQLTLLTLEPIESFREQLVRRQPGALSTQAGNLELPLL